METCFVNGSADLFPFDFSADLHGIVSPDPDFLDAYSFWYWILRRGSGRWGRRVEGFPCACSTALGRSNIPRGGEMATRDAGELRKPHGGAF